MNVEYFVDFRDSTSIIFVVDCENQHHFKEEDIDVFEFIAAAYLCSNGFVLEEVRAIYAKFNRDKCDLATGKTLDDMTNCIFGYTVETLAELYEKPLATLDLTDESFDNTFYSINEYFSDKQVNFYGFL